ncbi:MAG: FliM/FliN family flagellar motor switch protein [Candidatus Latescibacterota bacterium]
MASVLTEGEVVDWQQYQRAQEVRRVLSLPEEQVSVEALLACVEVLPSLAQEVLEACRQVEPGSPDEDLRAAAARLGAEDFRCVVAERAAGVLSQWSLQHVTSNYDFRHPARINKDQLRTLEGLHDNFARLLSSTLSGAMRAVVDVNTAFVDQTTYAEFIRSLSNPSCSYQFVLGPTPGQAIIDVPLPLVLAFVDRVYGGKGSSQGGEGRQLTPIEIGVINRIIKRVIEDLEATWEPILRLEIADIELETNPEFMQITAAQEIVVLLCFEVKAPNASGLVSLCYPYFTLESILPRLGQRTYWRTALRNREELCLYNRLRLGGMELEAAVELGRTRITLAEARSLEVGDVVRLPARPQDPVNVCLGGKPKFLARPFTAPDGQIHVKVVGVQ